MSDTDENTPRFPDWEELYREHNPENMPWYFAELDPDIMKALQNEIPKPKTILDIGTGPGTQAIGLANLGYDVTATDVAASAIKKAKDLEVNPGAQVKFIQDDILNSKITDTFDCIIDRGCFHCLDPKNRSDYAIAVKKLLKPDCPLLLKTFSTYQEEDLGPYKFTEDSIREVFKGHLQCMSFTHTIYQGTLEEQPKALLTVLRSV